MHTHHPLKKNPYYQLDVVPLILSQSVRAKQMFLGETILFEWGSYHEKT
jgi:hypothetical protein